MDSGLGILQGNYRLSFSKADVKTGFPDAVPGAKHWRACFRKCVIPVGVPNTGTVALGPIQPGQRATVQNGNDS
jgi:hypothetical protein